MDSRCIFAAILLHHSTTFAKTMRVEACEFLRGKARQYSHTGRVYQHSLCIRELAVDDLSTCLLTSFARVGAVQGASYERLYYS